MSALTLRSVKGSPLTVEELDHNFEWLQDQIDNKIELSDIPASYILSELLTVDGAGSGLDANRLDGYSTSSLANPNTVVIRDSNSDITASAFIGNVTGNVTGDVTGNVSGTSSDITGILSISNGGTGSNSNTGALNNLLPAGEQSGYVLKTGGEGSYYWSAETGAIATPGTRIDSQRTLTTASSSQTVFTVPTYVPGANQLRVYINGVRQFDSEYTETSSTSFTLSTGVAAGTEVLAEIDGYVNYDLAAADVSYTPTGSLTSTTVQNAIDELNSDVSAYVVPSGGIILWSGSSANIPSGWVLCDGSSGTPNLTDKFVVGAGSSYSVGSTGGSKDAIVPSHDHTFSGSATDKYIDQVQAHWLGGGYNTGTITISHSSSGTWSSRIATAQDSFNDGNNKGISFRGRSASSTVSGTTSSEGSSGTNANLPPYYALCYIMKT